MLLSVTPPQDRPGRLKLGHGCCESSVLRLDGEWVEPTELAISDGLREDLLGWQRFVGEHLLDTDHWDDPASRVEFRRRGRDLHRRLEQELGEVVDLDLTAQRVGW